jgi:hypothetical protein
MNIPAARRIRAAISPMDDLTTTTMRRNLGVIANVAVLLFVAYALLRPAGPVGAAVTRWREEGARRQSVRELWPEISSAARIVTSDAPAVLVEFTDYECRVCRTQHQMLKQLSKSPGIGSVVVRHYPLSQYARSEGAARSAICAEAQGRFPEMHDHLFSTDTWITDANWVREAEAAGVPDVLRFEKCLMSEQTSARLERDIELARKVGVTGTPAYAHYAEGLIVGGLRDTTFTRLAQLAAR